ncbi:hypothetical protein TNCV_1426191 [Trichonephila clavipes]|nr:hypothetical protein TNCV_1426191 [Trichonephila clavipes]
MRRRRSTKDSKAEELSTDLACIASLHGGSSAVLGSNSWHASHESVILTTRLSRPPSEDRCVKKPIHVKSVVFQSPHVGWVWKSREEREMPAQILSSSLDLGSNYEVHFR